jgi:hypothetical protein
MNSSQQLIESFRRAHEEILMIINHITGLTRSYPHARSRLPELEERLLAHLGRQDRNFYQKLSDHYLLQKEQVKMIEFLVHDLKETKIKFLIFFEKHAVQSGNMVGAGFFPKDFTDFKDTIVNRLKMEEEYLLPLLAGLPSQEQTHLEEKQKLHDGEILL